MTTPVYNLVQTDPLTQLMKWGHDHTHFIHTIRYGLDGVAVTFGLIGLVTMTSQAIPLMMGSALCFLFVEVCIVALDILGVLAIDRNVQAYTPGTINESCLYYENNLPILKIRAQNHYTAGYDHGYLTAHQVVSVYKRMKLLFLIGYLRIDNRLYNRLNEIKKMIPEPYLDEMRGVVDGVNERLRQDSWWPMQLTLEDLLQLHLIPDLMHLALSPPKFLMGCTAVVGKDPQTNQVQVARNLDWPGFGIGRLTLLKITHIDGKKPFLESTFAGAVGAISGANSTLFVSMNVAEPKEPIQDPYISEGMLSLFLNRQVLETDSSVQDTLDAKRQAAVPYHMLVADQNTAVFFHHGQHHDRSTIVREMNLKVDQPHFTLNCWHSTNEPLKKPTTRFYGNSRYENVHRIWTQKKSSSLNEKLDAVSQAPGINNPMTVHSLQWDRKFFELRYDGGFAGTSSVRHKIDISEHLSV